MHFPVLSMLIWHSVLAAIWVLWCGPQREDLARKVAIASSVLSVCLAGYLLLYFNYHTYMMQFMESWRWLPWLNVSYSLGIDGISLPMVLLTVFVNALLVLFSNHLIKTNTTQYLAVFLIMQAMTLGIFCAMDAILFYLFWEGVLIPMYLCIGVWGAEERSYAAVKFFIYTFLGSALMLVGLLYLGIKAGTFQIPAWYQLTIGYKAQIFLFIGFFLAFGIKVPMVPVHTWLPDAHTEAPPGGSVILAALMLKVGAYGFFRFSLPIVPDACEALSGMMIILSLIAIVYIGFIAIGQTDMKRLIAYSSVAHMGFVTLGCFAIYAIFHATHLYADAQTSLEGALVQMVSHAFGSGAMFLAFWLIYEQMHTRKIADFGGIVQAMPYFTAFFVLFSLSNVGLPGTTGFVGEFMVIFSVFKANFWLAVVTATTVILSASYTLWMVKRVFYGPVIHQKVIALRDINTVEFVILMSLAVVIIILGVMPNLMLSMMHSSIAHLLKLSLQTRLPV